MDFLEKVQRGRGDPARRISGVVKKLILPAVILVVLVIGLGTSVYTVDTDSQGVIRRFGRYVRTTEPGIHAQIPFGIETAVSVPVKKIQKEEFGFRTVKSGIKSEYVGVENIKQFSSRTLSNLLKERMEGYGDAQRQLLEEMSSEYLMLTGDLNVADVEWVVQFRIKDPVAYLFNIRDTLKTVRDLTEAAMRRVVGDASVDEVITIGRMVIANKVAEMLQEILDSYQSGVQVITVKLQSVNPPRRVRPAFNEVNESKQDRERLINEAWRAYNEAIPKARGEAEKIIKEAEAYAVERVNRAGGDADKFKSIFAEYKQARDVTRRRLYLEALKEMLPKIGRLWVIEQKGAEGGILQELRIGGESQ